MSYFTYREKLIPERYFDILYEEIKDKVDKTNSQRKSCLYNLHDIHLFNYDNIPTYKYFEVPKCLEEIRTIVEKDSGEIFDYVLVHLYMSGKSSIAYHNDKEAFNSEIASVSLGATRKFRLRDIEKKSGWRYEFSLTSGDCIYMHKPSIQNSYIGCQTKFVHSIPIELKVREPRINLTFRQYEI